MILYHGAHSEKSPAVVVGHSTEVSNKVCKMSNENTAREYNHLDGKLLWDWYSITITTLDDGSKSVTFNSRLHANKHVTLPMTWGEEFTDSDILKDPDLIRWATTRYGYSLTITNKD